MKKILFIFLVLSALSCAQRATAQYYTWGSDAPMKWNTIRAPGVRMIYPDTVETTARRTLFYINTVKPFIGYGFTHGPMKIPFVMHPENFRSNGLVMYLPKRIEFLTSPSVDSYSMPWIKQLVAHEYRHAVQYNNLDRGIVRVLSRILGQQGSTIGLLVISIWAIEGDATMCETMMSSFGRGLQPSFSMAYRAIGEVGQDRKNIDRWFSGSYREHIPDHYQLGYQICSYAYERYGENIWNKISRYGARNLYVIFPETFGLKKFYNTSATKLFRNTFDQLDSFWAGLPQVEDSALPIVELDKDNYTTYEWPMEIADSSVLAIKTDYARPTRFVKIDPRTGEEQRVAWAGRLSTRPSLAAGRVWWTEYRRSKLFEQRVGSQLCYMDLSDAKPRSVIGKRNVLYPTAIGADSVAWVEYNPDGSYIVVERLGGQKEQRYQIPYPKEIHGLAWDNITRKLYVIVTGNSGMWLGQIGRDGLKKITPGAYITLSNLRAHGGRLFFGSIASGKDEAHCYDLASGQEYQITESKYGSFSPSPTLRGDSAAILVTTYSRHGYALALQQKGDWRKVIPSNLPVNLVNPIRKRWDVVNLDTVSFTSVDSTAQLGNFREKRYRKFPNMANIHSWLPVAFDPFSVVDEQKISINLGATVMSQNLLSNTEAFAYYGWNRDQGSLFKMGVRNYALGVRFDFDASYGGKQLFYDLRARNGQGDIVSQERPQAKSYYSLGLAASLPLYFQRGYHTRQLSISTGWNFSNGMVFDANKIVWQGNEITNLDKLGFKEGLHKLSFGVAYSDQVLMAHRDFAPRFGYTLSVGYLLNPTNRDFSDLATAYAKVYLPGFLPHNSLVISAAYQTSIGGYRFPSGSRPLSYRSLRLIPRGFSSTDIISDNYMAISGDYQLPIWYPEGGIGSFLYFKRIRLNVGGDYASFRVPVLGANQSQHIWSVGGDIILDVNIFRQPAAATTAVKLSIYRPSKGGVWYTAGLSLPF